MPLTAEALPFAGAREIAEAIAQRRVSPVEVVEAALRRIEAINPLLNAFLSVDGKGALEAAQAAARVVERGETAPLLGVPISIKDLVLTRGGRTTAGSRIFGAGLGGERDAPVVARLRRAGAIILGKNNLHELALGVTNLNEHFGPARNPWDPARVPGGSSGGSAAAVAAGMGCASVGSDTRGSIRIPAACCGVTGLKPTYGLVSTEDVVPLSWSLDHVGPITRSVEDAALLLGGMVGGRRRIERYLAALERPVESLRFGTCEYFLRDLEPEIENAVRTAIELFRDAGCSVSEISMPELEPSHGASAAITLAEAVTFHQQALAERPEGFGPAVRGRLENGFKLTAVDLVRAERQRGQIQAAFARVFREVDCIVGATLPAFPAIIGQDGFKLRGRDTTLLTEYPRLTAPANLAGIPALALPCGQSQAGLPVSLQLMADTGNEEAVFTAGAHYQRLTEWHRARPAV